MLRTVKDLHLTAANFGSFLYVLYVILLEDLNFEFHSP